MHVFINGIHHLRFMQQTVSKPVRKVLSEPVSVCQMEYAPTLFELPNTEIGFFGRSPSPSE